MTRALDMDEAAAELRISRRAFDIIRTHVLTKLPHDGGLEFDAFVAKGFTGSVYILRCNDRVKIGFTTHWKGRLRVLRTACPYPVKVLAVFPGNRTLEQFLHIGFSPYRAHGEWFEEDGELALVTAAIEAIGR